MENFRYAIFDEYGDVVLCREHYDIPKAMRIYLEELLDLIFCRCEYDIDKEVF